MAQVHRGTNTYFQVPNTYLFFKIKKAKNKKQEKDPILKCPKHKYKRILWMRQQKHIGHFLNGILNLLTVVTQGLFEQSKATVCVSLSCPTLCEPMDCSSLGSTVHEILQTRTLEQVLVSFPRGSSLPQDQTQVSCVAGRFFTSWATSWSRLAYLE